MKPLATAARLLIRAGIGLIATAAVLYGVALAANFEPASNNWHFITVAAATLTLNAGILALTVGLFTGALHGIAAAFRPAPAKDTMATQATLPPITIEHAIGLAGDRNEPVTADHLNTGISAHDARAYTATAPTSPAVQGMHRAAAYTSFTAAAVSIGASVLRSAYPDNEGLNILAAVLSVAGLLGIAAAIIIGVVAKRRSNRYAKAAKEFQGSVMTILRTQGQLICLPFIYGYEHYAVVTAIRKDLEIARFRLLDHAGDGHGPLVGEPELLAAMAAVGDYARTEHPTHQQYETARDAARAFVNLQEETTGQLTSTASKRKQAQ